MCMTKLTSWCLLFLLTLACHQHVSGVQACSGLYSSESGSISSPSYPSQYPENQDCIYIINVTEGYRITLTFLTFELQAGEDGCPYDFLQIRDGSSEASPSFGVFCDTTFPGRLRSSGNTLWIKFHSDSSQSGAGFEASYTTAVIPQNFLLVTNGVLSSIQRIDIDTLSSFVIPIVGLRAPIAVDYDPPNNRIYWRDVQEKTIRSASLDGSDVRLVRDLGPNAIPDGLSVDSLSRLIFYTDAGNKVIGMITMYSNVYRPVIDSGLDLPRDIELDKHNGMMYWSDWGAIPKIEQANYDGTERQTLVSGSPVLGWPNALALDTAGRRLYWADAQTDMIGWVDVDGRITSVILRTPGTYYFGMDIYLSSLFLTDWSTAGDQAVTTYLNRITTDGSSEQTIATANGRLNDVRVYAEETEDKGPNGCGSNTSVCDFICLPRPGNTSKCLVQDATPTSFTTSTPTTSIHATTSSLTEQSGVIKSSGITTDFSITTPIFTSESDRTATLSASFTTSMPTTSVHATTSSLTEQSVFIKSSGITTDFSLTTPIFTSESDRTATLSETETVVTANVIGTIVGAVIGGAAAIGIVVSVVCVLKRKQRVRNDEEPVAFAAQQVQHHDPHAAQEPPSAIGDSSAAYLHRVSSLPPCLGDSSGGYLYPENSSVPSSDSSEDSEVENNC